MLKYRGTLCKSKGCWTNMAKKRFDEKFYIEHMKRNKGAFFVYVLLRTFVMGTMAFSIIRGNYEAAFMCLLVMFLLILPLIIERRFNIELPSVLEVIVMLFVFASLVLGELGNYYIKFSHWDTILHTVNGFLCAAVGFGLVDILNRNEKIKLKLSPIFLAVVAFCFSMTIGAVWELFEFACDVFMGFDMQNDMLVSSFSSSYLSGSTLNLETVENIQTVSVNGHVMTTGGYLDIGLYDTMMDLAVNLVGAFVFSVIGYFYVKFRGRTKFAHHFIPRLKKWKKEDVEEKTEQNEN